MKIGNCSLQNSFLNEKILRYHTAIGHPAIADRVKNYPLALSEVNYTIYRCVELLIRLLIGFQMVKADGYASHVT